MKNKSKELEVAIEAAKKGAAHALLSFNKAMTVSYKDDETPVTIIDEETEEIIKNYILSVFPHAIIVGEETGGEISAEAFWTIDPIDGTRSYSRGIPTWYVLISYIVNNEVQIGVCYQPNTKQLLYAERGKGTFLNTTPVFVSKTTSLKEAFAGYGSFKYFKDRKKLLRFIDAFPSTRGWDATYSNFLLCLGKLDAFYEAYGQLWDIAPFKVILEEAGGKITDHNGKPWTVHTRGCLATNGIVHNEVLAVLQKD